MIVLTIFFIQDSFEKLSELDTCSSFGMPVSGALVTNDALFSRMSARWLHINVFAFKDKMLVVK